MSLGASSRFPDRIIVVEASIDHYSVVDAHVALARTEARSFRGGDRLPEPVTLDGSAPTRERLVLIARFRESIIGSLVAMRRDDHEWRVEHVHVVVGCRDAGAGDALMDDLKRRLGERSVRWLSGHALPGDRQMKNLFERQGMTAQLLELGGSLD